MKKFVLVLLAVIMILMLVGCGESTETVDNNTSQYEDRELVRDTGMFEIIYIDGNVRILVDHETGVQYVLTKPGGITPRINNDGTIYIEKNN